MSAVLARGDRKVGLMAIDLDISQIRIAVLRSLAKDPLTDDDADAIERMRRYLTKSISVLNPPEEIPQSLVPKEALREALERAFSSMVSSSEAVDANKVDTLKKVMAFLDKMLRDNYLALEDATYLIDNLKPRT
jgi:hypothetical protein